VAFDQQAEDEGWLPCARDNFCEMQLVRPGKVQCPCDDPDSLSAELREMAEELRESKAEYDDLSWEHF
jgi:hypothetical protein